MVEVFEKCFKNDHFRCFLKWSTLRCDYSHWIFSYGFSPRWHDVARHGLVDCFDAESCCGVVRSSTGRARRGSRGAHARLRPRPGPLAAAHELLIVKSLPAPPGAPGNAAWIYNFLLPSFRGVREPTGSRQTLHTQTTRGRLKHTHTHTHSHTFEEMSVLSDFHTCINMPKKQTRLSLFI